MKRMRAVASLLATAVCVAALLGGCAAPPAAPHQPHHPHLAAPVYGITHVDPGQSDAIPYPVARGQYRVELGKLEPIAGGPVNIMTFASTAPGFMWALSTDRIAYVDARDGRWHALADQHGGKRAAPINACARLKT